MAFPANAVALFACSPCRHTKPSRTKSMAAKLHYAGISHTSRSGGQQLYMFHCPGCGCAHGFHVPRWDWNGSLDAPTFSPSLLCNAQAMLSRCHSFVRDGNIQFLSDCWHVLAGQTVPLPDWE